MIPKSRKCCKKSQRYGRNPDSLANPLRYSRTGSALNQIYEAHAFRQERVPILDVSHDVLVVGRRYACHQTIALQFLENAIYFRHDPVAPKTVNPSTVSIVRWNVVAALQQFALNLDQLFQEIDFAVADFR